MTTTTPKPRRGWALTGAAGGFAGAVGIFLGANLTADAGDAINDNARLVTAIAAHRDLVWLYQVSCVLAAACLVVFAAGLHRHLAVQEPAGSLVPAVAAAGAGLVAVATLVGGGICTELYWALGEPERWDPDTIAAMVEVYNTVGWLWAGAGISAAAVAVGGFRHGSASRWLAAVSALLALLVAATQAFPAQYGALFPGALWVLVAGLGLGLRGTMSRDAGTV
ncbi:hypothetical protein OHA72_31845 [Dactylosporangium sp. NBC_01737]|uniref:hypothetical protein n=1 Tax=Dactylosporangium sp. NBC_01737 TaxID=2975959 RepID=UPI002E163639|nr:hypothetical protein OHA72_31845 [Dactylosporangium sp. NBC_01737]